MKDLRIIFMGTPDFAVPSLSAIMNNGYHVVGVITAPDKPRGRGRKVSYSPVKSFALAHDIPVLQPTNLKSPEFFEELSGYQANLQVVVAFRMLPEIIWSMPELGTFNLHPPLVPAYRGAAPINWAIINGEKQTGLTTFFLKHEIDTGNIILQEEEPILEHDTGGSLYERLMIKGGQVVARTVDMIARESYVLREQQAHPNLKKAPKIHKEDCEINWNRSLQEIYDFIRGMSPFPGAFTYLNGRYFKVYFGEKKYDSAGQLPGTLDTDHRNYIRVKATDGFFEITDFQPEGKKRMSPKEYLIGNKI
jgi:methionyl-tRNA formyltransferase